MVPLGLLLGLRSEFRLETDGLLRLPFMLTALRVGLGDLLEYRSRRFRGRFILLSLGARLRTFPGLASLRRRLDSGEIE